MAQRRRAAVWERDLTADPFHLERFVTAQAGTFDGALAELRRGRKTGHWMWFVFPQLAGLGRSETSRRYGIASLDEARAYLAHPVLGPRLLACVEVVAAVDGASAEAILGPVDAMKLRSCVTLFAAADPAETRFTAVLDRWFGGVPDPATLALLP